MAQAASQARTGITVRDFASGREAGSGIAFENGPERGEIAQQLALLDPPRRAESRLYARYGRSGEGRIQPARPLCAGCREKEARYGFRSEDDPAAARPRTLCFECFRVEIGRRQAVAAQLARGWNAHQTNLPLEEKLDDLSRRRRRAQIAARHALGL